MAAATTQETRTEFVGRIAELAAVTAAFRRGERLCTLVGPGGIGKTRLAMEWTASAPRDATGRRLRFCDCAEARDSHGLLAAVGASVGEQGEAVAAEEPLILAALQRLGASVLVLDNLEQIAAAAADIVQSWLDAAPELRVLATSRLALGLSRELVLPLPGLPVPERGGDTRGTAVELLVRRASRANPGFSVSDDELLVLGATARRLEGIPLALELAAARLEVLTPAELEGRLGADFGVLRSSDARVVERHSTLRAAVQWSWQLLGPSERRALLALSVFRGGASIGAAAAVLEVSGDEALDLVQALSRSSLARVQSEPERRVVLYEAVRDFAQAQMAQGSLERTRSEALHAQYFAREGWRRAEAWTARGSSEAFGWLERNAHNLQAAASVAAHRVQTEPGWATMQAQLVLGLDAVLSTRGPWGELQALLERALGAQGLPFEWRAALGISLGRLLRQRGAVAEAVEILAHAENDAVAGESPAGAARAALERGIGEHHRGQVALARELFELAEASFRACGLERERARAQGSLAVVAHEEGRLREAERDYEEALDVFRELDDWRSLAVFLTNLGDLHKESGRFELAAAEYTQALEYARALGERRVEGVLLGNLGGLEEERGNYAEARRLRLAAAGIQGQMGDRRTEAIFTGLVARIDHVVGDPEGARRGYRQVCKALSHAQDRRWEAIFRALWALAAAHTGRAEEAEQELARAREAASCVAEPQIRASLDAYEALVAHALGRDLADSRELLRARARLDGLGAGQGDEVRFAKVWLSRALGTSSAPEQLVVARSGSWFRLGARAPVSLDRRRTLQRLFMHLAHRRDSAAGRGAPLAELVDAGWPGERVLPQAAANRVYVAVTTLRKMGLGDVLKASDDGWCLDPDVPFRWDHDAS
jgi:predicted ATPase